MVRSIGELLLELNFYEYHKIFLDNSYYETLFPFLLSFALFYTVLSHISLFKNKKTKKPFSALISVIALVVSWFGVGFEISEGHSVGELISIMFPNISALSIGILSLYIVGGVMGKDFFKGLFKKNYSSYLFLSVGGIGLGAVIFYLGISMGFFDYDFYDIQGYWSTIFAIAILIVGVVFLINDSIPMGILLLIIFGSFIYNSGEGNILEYFIDPVIFIIMLVVILLSWLGSDSEKKSQLARDLNDRESSKNFKKFKPFQSRLDDISSSNYENRIKKWNKKYGKEDHWNKYR